ncbi:hypothetical protein [Campylobacter lanienae]|uniref:hypothetical protein n=1 Tax=Campylobacter lanienae TaxID=75658 RepID=UPI00242AF9EE|nr:hypothetical protein [Campylobacter lanienae]MDD5786023.1 hypothetical protein [Campylobacter lanienae]
MFVAIKSINSHAYELNTKRIELRGGCYLNEISKDDFQALRDKYACIDEFIDKGFYVVSDSKNANTEVKASDETLQSIKDNQDSTIKANESRTRAKIVKG